MLCPRCAGASPPRPGPAGLGEVGGEGCREDFAIVENLFIEIAHQEVRIIANDLFQTPRSRANVIQPSAVPVVL